VEFQCPKLEVWYDGDKGGLALEAVQYYLIYTSTSEALRGRANGSVNALRAERTNGELSSSRGCRQGNSTWVSQGRKSPVFIHKGMYYLHITILRGMRENTSYDI
jgi:hypothetical protein